MKHLLSPIFYLLCIGFAAAQGTVRVDNATKAVTDPTSLWTANAAAIDSALGNVTLTANAALNLATTANGTASGAAQRDADNTLTGNNTSSGNATTLRITSSSDVQGRTNFEFIAALGQTINASVSAGSRSSTVWVIGDSYSNDMNDLGAVAITGRNRARGNMWSDGVPATNVNEVGGSAVPEFPGVRVAPGAVLRSSGASGNLTSTDNYNTYGMKVVYMRGSTTGNLSVWTSHDAGATYSQIGSTVNTTLSSGNATWASTLFPLSNTYAGRARFQIRTEGVNIFLPIIYLHGNSGIAVIKFPDAVGGWEWESDPFDPELFGALVAAVGANYVMVACSNDSSAYEEGEVLDTLIAGARAVSPNLGWIDAGPFALNAYSQAFADDRAATQRAWCLRNRAVFWERRPLMQEIAQAMGWGILSDGVHLSAIGRNICYVNFWRDLAPLLPGGKEQLTPFTSTFVTSNFEGMSKGLALMPLAYGTPSGIRLMDGNSTDTTTDSMDLWMIDDDIRIGHSLYSGGVTTLFRFTKTGVFRPHQNPSAQTLGTSTARWGTVFGTLGDFQNISANGTVTLTGNLSTTGITLPSGNLTMNATASRLIVRSGSNAASGVATLVNGTITVSNSQTSTTTKVIPARDAVNASTAIGQLQVTPATGNFTINSLSANGSVEAGDQSTVNWLLVQPSP